MISNRHRSTEYNKLLYVCGGEGYCKLLLILQFLIYSTSNIAIPDIHSMIMTMREASRFSEAFEFKS